MSYDAEQLVSVYIAIRGERERILAEYETADEKLKEDLEKIKKELLKICNTVNAETIRTPAGTIMRKLNERFYCSDYDSFKKFVVENNAIDLFERRIHQSNFKQFMSDHEGDGLPPGVNVMREFDISVRKPSASLSNTEAN